MGSSQPPELLPNQHKGYVKLVKAEDTILFLLGRKLEIALRYLVVFLDILTCDLELRGGMQGVKRNDFKEAGLTMRRCSFTLVCDLMHSWNL